MTGFFTKVFNAVTSWSFASKPPKALPAGPATSQQADEHQNAVDAEKLQYNNCKAEECSSNAKEQIEARDSTQDEQQGRSNTAGHILQTEAAGELTDMKDTCETFQPVAARLALADTQPFSCADTLETFQPVTPRPALAEKSVNTPLATPMTTSKRFMLDDGQVKGIANTVNKYDEKRPVRVIHEPFEERVSRVLEREQQLLGAINPTS